MRNLSIFFSIAGHSIREHYKNRFFHLLLVFAGVLIYASILLGVMAVDEEYRVLLDFGFGLMELMSLVFVVFISATAITKEIEFKTIYLVFTRPVPKPVYISGKIFSIFASTAIILFIMSMLHISLLLLRGFSIVDLYFMVILFMWFKLLIIASLTVFISMFSTSMISTVTISVILWTLGHFMSETKFLIEKAKGLLSTLLKLAVYVIPNLQLYNLKDVFEVETLTGIFWYHRLGY
ncbi:MAG: hypothetical protein AB1633_13240, partial [Elusimicrobiota bacterium]